MIRNIQSVNLWLLAMVALGAILRATVIGFGLPYIVHPDEGVTVSLALRILHTGDFNPNFFHWSSLTIYVNAFAYFIFFLIGRAAGRFDAPSDVLPLDIEAIATGKVLLVEEFLIARALNILIGIFAIAVAYRLTLRLSNSRVAASLAALFIALEPTTLRVSQYIHPDTYLIAFVLLAAYFSICILDDPCPRNYFLAALFAGFATGSKYNAAIVCVAIFAAHLGRFGWRGIRRREIYFAALIAAATFLITTPFALFDASQFIASGPLEDAAHYSSGHAGAEGDTLRYYGELLWNALGGVLIIALVEIFLLARRRDPKQIILLSFPLAYFLFVAQFKVHFDTTILPIIPFLLILAAQFIARAFGWIENKNARAARITALAAIILLTFPMFRADLDNNARLLQPDARDFARAWIESNLPPGSRIALESYAPYVPRPQFMVEGFEGMIEHPPKWYEQNGFEYLVFSYGSYGRFYENPAPSADFIAQYDAFFKRYSETARFNQNGYEVRVYKIGAPELPTNRVAARFGIYAGWVELVGYDLRALVWASGETQRIGFYWRALVARKESLTLTARVIDSTGRELSFSRGPLFGDAYAVGAWPESIARSGLDIIVPPSALSGLYRVQLEVEGEGIGRVPLLSYTNQAVSDKLFIGPFKVTGPPLARDEVAKSNPVNANFAKQIALLGYTLSPPLARAGDPITLTCYWRADLKMDENYSVFVHLLDPRGAVRAQIDSQPRGGLYPTSIWDRGEIVRDDYVLKLPADFAPGEYRISIGWYAFPSLARLGMSDSTGRLLDDHLILDQVVTVK